MLNDESESRSQDETILAQFMTEPEDATGLAAYALHRRALAEFIRNFTASTGKAPDETVIAQFLIGETMPGRIDSYRAEAKRLIMQQMGGSVGRPPTMPDPKRFFSWGLGEAIAHAEKPLPWRALAKRLLLLLAAVIVTALLLRVLVVSP
jgi:hypothetical protein